LNFLEPCKEVSGKTDVRDATSRKHLHRCFVHWSRGYATEDAIHDCLP
jgi:hypothetical protein